MKKFITCIICPKGCKITAEIHGKRISVTGNSCKRGEKHAISECTNPVRMLTSSVPIQNREGQRVSVKSLQPVPKEHIMEIMSRIHELKAEAPITMGQVILSNVYGTNIVATKEIE